MSITKEEFIDVCNQYVGTLKEEKKCIKFFNENRLIQYYSDGKLRIDKKVYCEISLNDVGLDGYFWQIMWC